MCNLRLVGCASSRNTRRGRCCTLAARSGNCVHLSRLAHLCPFCRAGLANGAEHTPGRRAPQPSYSLGLVYKFEASLLSKNFQRCVTSFPDGALCTNVVTTHLCWSAITNASAAFMKHLAAGAIHTICVLISWRPRSKVFSDARSTLKRVTASCCQ